MPRNYIEVLKLRLSLHRNRKRKGWLSGGTGFETVKEALELELCKVEKLGNGVLLKYNHKKGIN